MTLTEFQKPSGQDRDIAPIDLLLDSNNLRLLEHVDEDILNTPADEIGTSPIQAMILNTFRNEPQFKLESLISSITSLGFLRNDRLIVAPYDGSKFLVLEGNRRLSAVKVLLEQKERLSPFVKSSLQTLPCYEIAGDPISGSEDRLKTFRSGALQYIGVRHLTGIQRWEPASRYEFLARLIEDGERALTPQQVAELFGQPLSAVMRDYRAHLLYRSFRDYEAQLRLRRHKFTYNTFAEASRSPDIRDWLGWSDTTQRFENELHMKSFFDYVIKEVGTFSSDLFEEEDWSPEESAERVVRRFRDMLKRNDPEILSNLEEGNFPRAHDLFELRRLGKLDQRLKSYVSGLKSVSKSEMQESSQTSIALLQDLSREAQELKSIIEKLL